MQTRVLLLKKIHPVQKMEFEIIEHPTYIDKLVDICEQLYELSDTINEDSETRAKIIDIAESIDAIIQIENHSDVKVSCPINIPVFLAKTPNNSLSPTFYHNYIPSKNTLPPLLSCNTNTVD